MNDSPNLRLQFVTGDIKDPLRYTQRQGIENPSPDYVNNFLVHGKKIYLVSTCEAHCVRFLLETIWLYVHNVCVCKEKLSCLGK